MDLDFDRQHIWHPYTSVTRPDPVFPIVRAEGVYIYTEDGKKLIDGMASWWSVLHGYNHPTLNDAIQTQMQAMSHVMFGGLTHKPAIELCKKLVSLTPAGLEKVFLSDSGSVSVEVAIKMALQYWHSTGKPEKNRLLSLHNGYHGDTFGAMSVCDPVTGMHSLFTGSLTPQFFTESPRCGFSDEWDEGYTDDIQQQLEKHQHELAAVILEPIVQGAGGMRFYSPHYLKRVRELCDHYDILLIADEIATGFGRTGKLFACEHANISPDILCVGKTLTGGTLTLAATLCTNKVATVICEGDAGVLMHGPTFMANPLACAAANANIQLLLEPETNPVSSEPWQSQVARIEQQLKVGLEPLKNNPLVNDVRCLGAIGVVELHEPVKLAEIQPQFVEQNIWVRPFGKLIYVMPPYITTNAQIKQLTQGITQIIQQLA